MTKKERLTIHALRRDLTQARKFCTDYSHRADMNERLLRDSQQLAINLRADNDKLEAMLATQTDRADGLSQQLVRERQEGDLQMDIQMSTHSHLMVAFASLRMHPEGKKIADALQSNLDGEINRVRRSYHERRDVGRVGNGSPNKDPNVPVTAGEPRQKQSNAHSQLSKAVQPIGQALGLDRVAR